MTPMEQRAAEPLDGIAAQLEAIMADGYPDTLVSTKLALALVRYAMAHRAATVADLDETKEAMLSNDAARELRYARREAPKRGGYIWEAARIGYEAGAFKDPTLDELLTLGFLKPHPDPTKGWIPATPSQGA